MKRYAFFDVDNTLFDGHTTSSFWEYLAKHRIIDPDTYKEMFRLHNLYADKKISYLEVSQKVQSTFCTALKGHSKKEIEKWGLKYLKSKQFFFPYAEKVIGFLKENGFEVHIISGAAAPIVNPVGLFLGIDKVHSTLFSDKEDVYDGTLNKVLIYEEKKLLVHSLLEQIKGTQLKVGFGDSTGDVDMLIHMHLSFIINPHEPIMHEHAKKYKWVVTQEADVMIQMIKKRI